MKKEKRIRICLIWLYIYRFNKVHTFGSRFCLPMQTLTLIYQCIHKNVKTVWSLLNCHHWLHWYLIWDHIYSKCNAKNQRESHHLISHHPFWAHLNADDDVVLNSAILLLSDSKLKLIFTFLDCDQRMSHCLHRDCWTPNFEFFQLKHTLLPILRCTEYGEYSEYGHRC